MPFLLAPLLSRNIVEPFSRILDSLWKYWFRFAPGMPYVKKPKQLNKLCVNIQPKAKCYKKVNTRFNIFENVPFHTTRTDFQTHSTRKRPSRKITTYVPPCMWWYVCQNLKELKWRWYRNCSKRFVHEKQNPMRVQYILYMMRLPLRKTLRFLPTDECFLWSAWT